MRRSNRLEMVLGAGVAVLVAGVAWVMFHSAPAHVVILPLSYWLWRRVGYHRLFPRFRLGEELEGLADRASIRRLRERFEAQVNSGPATDRHRVTAEAILGRYGGFLHDAARKPDLIREFRRTNAMIRQVMAVTCVLLGAILVGVHAWDIGGLSAESTHSRGIALFERQDYEQALPPLREAAFERPGNPAYRYDLAICYHRLERWDNAMREYLECLKINPMYTDAVYNLGLVYGKLGDQEMESAQYQKVLELDETYADASYSLGVLQLRKGEFEEAKRSFQEAARHYPEASEWKSKALEMLGALNDPDMLKEIQSYLDGDG